MIRSTFLLLHMLFAFWAALLAQEEHQSWDSGGYIKYLQSATWLPDSSLTTNHLIHHRLNVKWFPRQYWKFSLEMRNRLFYGEETKLNPQYGKLIDQYDGLFDGSVLWVDNPSIVLHSLIDRASLNYSQGAWDITLGRQRINWGINTLWNPNDIFNAFNFLDFDYEERPGSDAVRIQYFPGLMSRLEAAYAPGKTWDESVLGILYGFNVAQYDIQALAGYQQGEWISGVGWAGYLGGAGFKGEATYFVPDKSSRYTQQAMSLSLSGDYQTPGGIYFNAGLLYNSQPSPIFLLGTQNLNGGELSPRSLFPSTWTFSLSGSGQPHPLVSTGLNILYANEENLTLILPNISYSIKENWDLDFFLQTFLGAFQGDYSHLASSAFFRLKWSY